MGTATASNNFFREIGASLGGAVVGALFTSRLTDLFAERMPATGEAGDVNSFTPALIGDLPEALHEIVIGAYNDALTPVFAMLIPMVLAGLVLALFIREVPLRASLDEGDEGDVPERHEGAGSGGEGGPARSTVEAHP